MPFYYTHLLNVILYIFLKMIRDKVLTKFTRFSNETLNHEIIRLMICKQIFFSISYIRPYLIFFSIL